MKSFVLLLLIALFTAPVVIAGEPPNHLEPTVPYGWTGDLAEYGRIVHKRLIGDREALLWMLVHPAFTPQYSVMMDLAATHGDSIGTYCRLRTFAFNENIWYWKEREGEKQSEFALDSSVVVERRTASLPAEIGSSILELWERVLKGTRYPEEPTIGLDGVTYQFCATGMYGKTWSPKSGVPKLMVDCGELMIEYVKAEEKKREECLQRLNELLKQLQKELE